MMVRFTRTSTQGQNKDDPPSVVISDPDSACDFVRYKHKERIGSTF